MIFAASLGLFLSGTISAMLGTLLPTLSARAHLTPEQNGGMALAQAIGFVLASMLSGPLIDTKGTKTAFFSGLALVIAALVALPNSSTGTMITFCMFLLGLGSGILMTGSNVLVSEIGGERRAAMLSFSQVFFAVGGLLTPLVAANFISGDAVRLCYPVLALTVAALGVNLVTAMPSPSRERSFRLSAVVALEEKPLLLVIALVAFFYVACEMAFWNWIPKLLMVKGIREKTALNILSLGFASGILVGRLAGSWILKRFSIVTIGLSASALMALTTYWTIWSTGAGMAWISVFCAGLVMAPVYPGTVGATGDSFPRMTATCIGIVGTSGWIGTATISWLIGAIAGSDDSRLRWALLVIPAFSVVLLGIILMLRPMLAATKARQGAGLVSIEEEPAA